MWVGVRMTRRKKERITDQTLVLLGKKTPRDPPGSAGGSVLGEGLGVPAHNTALQPSPR